MKLNIDFKLLEQQKKRLVRLLMQDKLDKKTTEALDGILHLLDAVQDQYEDGLIDLWIETFYQIAAILNYSEFEPLHTHIRDNGGMAELCTQTTIWINEFEKMNEGRQWDGEFFEEVEAFMHTKLNEVK